MTQPTGSNYPTGFDDASTLLGAPADRAVLRVASPIGVDSIVLVMDRDLSGYALPAYIVFEGGEIVYADAIGGASNDRFVLPSLARRGVLNTRVQPHGVGERVYLGLVSKHHALMKSAIQNTQRHQGLVGAEADLPEFPQPGWRYTALDTGRVHVCFVDNVWSWINVISHSDLTDLVDSDHDGLYHNDDAADIWHGGLSGEHIPGGDDHDHLSAGEGLPVARLAGGLHANRPEPASSSIWYSTDLDGGTLFIGGAKISGVPSGGIMAFDGPCPPGWTRHDALNERLPIGAPADDAGDEGGSEGHVHAYLEMARHYHSIAAADVNTGGATMGSHSYSAIYNAGSTKGLAYSSSATQAQSTSSGGGHTHTVNIPEHPTELSGAADAETASASSIPAARQVVWCEKD